MVFWGVCLFRFNKKNSLIAWFSWLIHRFSKELIAQFNEYVLFQILTTLLCFEIILSILSYLFVYTWKGISALVCQNKLLFNVFCQKRARVRCPLTDLFTSEKKRIWEAAAAQRIFNKMGLEIQSVHVARNIEKQA